MGTLFRSEKMQAVQLFIQIEAAHDTIDELGKLGVVQFRDLNPDVNAFQRHFVNEVKRAEEMDRILRYFAAELLKNQQDLQLNVAEVAVESGPASSKGVNFTELETTLDELEKDLLQMNSNLEMLHRSKNELIELQHVLQKDSNFFTETEIENREYGGAEKRPLLSEPSVARTIHLGFLTGVILRDKKPAFERVLWRTTRGNLFMKQAEIEIPIVDPHTGNEVNKNVFIIFYQGERAQQKIKKICESFGANLYPCPETSGERNEVLRQVSGRLNDLSEVIARTSAHRRQILSRIATHILSWKTKVVCEKGIYDTMNKFNYDIGRKCLIAEGWCPHGDLPAVQAALNRGMESSGASVASVLSLIKAHDTPPTYYRTNKFTGSFQDIIDAYGMARYQEVNPAPFSIITFPFLFAVMFGDVGHGVLLFLFALYLVLKEAELAKLDLNEMIKICFGGRYVLLLMGAFSVYTGFIYNECFSIPMNLFGSHWALPDTLNASGTIIHDVSTYCKNNTCEYVFDGGVYPFGVDPIWKGNTNELLYYNSLKMKMSILIAVIHMTFGIILSAFNAVYFKDYLGVFFEFIPQLVFLLGIFGYMCFLIIYKWAFWTTSDAPRLLTVMIDMFLSPLTLKDEDKVWDGQAGLQPILLILAVASVPIMLFVKPCVLKQRHKHGYVPVEDEEHGEHEEFDFGEVFVHQIIHTIEFVLGAISNTASYLRLWALSLAHSELSSVFWDKVMILTMKMNFFTVFVGFAIWAGCTFGVLLIMESLSAFLHALRLHWVEFMNKFYKGDGRKFQPFSYQKLLSGEEDE